MERGIKGVRAFISSSTIAVISPHSDTMRWPKTLSLLLLACLLSGCATSNRYFTKYPVYTDDAEQQQKDKEASWLWDLTRIPLRAAEYFANK
jgi:hypothetical protein